MGGKLLESYHYDPLVAMSWTTCAALADHSPGGRHRGRQQSQGQMSPEAGAVGIKMRDKIKLDSLLAHPVCVHRSWAFTSNPRHFGFGAGGQNRVERFWLQIEPRLK